MTFGVAGRYGAYLPIVAGLYLGALLKRPTIPRAVDNNRIQLCINTRDPYLFQSQCVDCNRQLFPGTVQSCTGFSTLQENITFDQAICLIENCTLQVPIQRYPMILPNGQGGNTFPNGPININGAQGSVPVNFQSGGYYPVQQYSGQGDGRRQPQFNTGQLQRYKSPNSKTSPNSGPTEYSGQTGKIQPSTFQEGQAGGPTEYSGKTGQIQPSTFQEGYPQSQAQQQQSPTEYSGQTGQIQPMSGYPANGGQIQNVPYPSPGRKQQQVKYIPRIQVQYRPVQQVVRRVVPQPQYTIRGKREAEEYFRAYDYQMEKIFLSERKSQARDLKLLFHRVITRTLKRVPRNKLLKNHKGVVGKAYKIYKVNMVMDNRVTFDL